MIYITAVVKAKPEAITALNDLYKPLVAATLQEADCHRYEVHRTTPDSSTIVMLEEWKTEEGLKAHNQTQHFQHFVSNVEPLLAEPLQIYITEKLF